MNAVTTWLPIVRWLPRYRRPDLGGDLTAGLTVAAMLIPQGMAYALLAGMPPQTGLYAATIPLVLYAVFGTSRQLAVGPVAIMSLLTASAIVPLAAEGSARYAELAALLAVMVAGVHFVLRLARAGWVVNLLSHPVLVGYTAAAALIIGLSQAKHLIGVKIPSTESFAETLSELWRALPDASAASMALSAGTIGLLITLRRWRKAFPAALAAVVVTTVAVTLFSLESHGVRVVGDIPGDLPVFALPTFEGDVFGRLIPAALVITLAGFMESIAISKVFARRNGYEIEPNQELTALGAANLGAGLFGGFPVTGGFSRTAVNAGAGARTPLASLFTVGIILVALVTLTPLLRSLPNAALGSIVVVAVSSLVDWKEARHIARVSRPDVVPMAVTFVATLALGVEGGIAVAIAVSLAKLFMRMTRPHTAEPGRVDEAVGSITGVSAELPPLPRPQSQPGVDTLA